MAKQAKRPKIVTLTTPIGDGDVKRWDWMPEAEAPPPELGITGETMDLGRAFIMEQQFDGTLIAVPAEPVDAVDPRMPPVPEDRVAAQDARLGQAPGRDGRRTSYIANPGPMPAADDPLFDFVPAPHSHPRRNSITAERQREFIACLAATGVVLQAAAHVGASPEALYNLRHKPGAEGFAAAWDVAVERGFARVEDGAVQRAIQGETRLVASGGKVIGYERRFNEALVMFLLRNRRPERYGGSGRSPKLPPLREARKVPAPALADGDAGSEPEPADLRGWKRLLLEQPGSVDLRRFTGFELERLEQMTPEEAYAPAPVPDAPPTGTGLAGERRAGDGQQQDHPANDA